MDKQYLNLTKPVVSMHPRKYKKVHSTQVAQATFRDNTAQEPTGRYWKYVQ